MTNIEAIQYFEGLINLSIGNGVYKNIASVQYANEALNTIKKLNNEQSKKATEEAAKTS